VRRLPIFIRAWNQKVAEKLKILIIASALSLGLALMARADDVADLFFAVTNIYGMKVVDYRNCGREVPNDRDTILRIMAKAPGVDMVEVGRRLDEAAHNAESEIGGEGCRGNSIKDDERRMTEYISQLRDAVAKKYGGK